MTINKSRNPNNQDTEREHFPPPGRAGHTSTDSIHKRYGVAGDEGIKLKNLNSIVR